MAHVGQIRPGVVVEYLRAEFDTSHERMQHVPWIIYTGLCQYRSLQVAGQKSGDRLPSMNPWGARGSLCRFARRCAQLIANELVYNVQAFRE